MIFGIVATHELIEDVVIPLDFQLECNARFLEKISLDISGGDLRRRSEVNANKLTLIQSKWVGPK